MWVLVRPERLYAPCNLYVLAFYLMVLGAYTRGNLSVMVGYEKHPEQRRLVETHGIP